jgi:hypothetical protein
VEVCETSDTMSWLAVRFFVLRLSCCLEVRGWRTHLVPQGDVTLFPTEPTSIVRYVQKT